MTSGPRPSLRELVGAGLASTPRAPRRPPRRGTAAPQVVAPTRNAWTQAVVASEHGGAGRRRARVVVPLVDVELARRAGEQRVVLRPRRRTRSRTQPISPAGMRSALPLERLGDQLRAEADAEHRQPARVHVGDQLALAVERRVAVGAVRVDDAAEHHQPVERPAGGSGCESAYQVTVRTPSAASGGSSAAGGVSRSCWTTSTVGFALMRRIFTHRRGGGADSRRYARCEQACCWRWGSSTSSGDRPTWRSA